MIRHISERSTLGLGAAAGKVLHLDRFRTAQSQSPLRQAEAYWTALCGETDVPKRSRIDPRGLVGALPYAFIAERIAPGIARFRLAGQKISASVGTEVAGMPISALFSGAARPQLAEHLEHVFTAPAIAELTLHRKLRFARKPVVSHMLLLPLRSEFGAIDRALGILLDQNPGDKPLSVSFDIAAATFRPIGSGQTRIGNTPAAAAAQRSAPARPNLRLVHNDPS